MVDERRVRLAPFTIQKNVGLHTYICNYLHMVNTVGVRYYLYIGMLDDAYICMYVFISTIERIETTVVIFTQISLVVVFYAS